MCGRYFVLDSKDVLFTSEKKYWSLRCSVHSLITCGLLAALTLVLLLSPGGRKPWGLEGTLHLPAQAALIGQGSSFCLCCAQGGSGLGCRGTASPWGGGSACPRIKKRWLLPAQELSEGTLGQCQMWCFSRRRLDWDLLNS